MPPSNMSIQTGTPSPLPTRHENVQIQELPIADMSVKSSGGEAVNREAKGDKLK